MCERLKQVLLQKIYLFLPYQISQDTHEKVLNIITNEGNANENHETASHIHQRA